MSSDSNSPEDESLQATQPDRTAGERAEGELPGAWTLENVVRTLGREPFGTTLFGLVRLLQSAQPQRQGVGYAPRIDEEAVRLEQSLLLGFAPSEVDALRSGPRRPVVRQSAIGLLGPNGPLPYHWTEFAHDLEHAEYHADRDTSFMAWLNLLQRRQLGFFYRAWADTIAATAYDKEGSSHPVVDRLRAIAGIALPGLQQRSTVSDDFKLAYAGVLSRRVRAPGPLAEMLAHYFGVPVEIEEFAAHWMEIPADQRGQLGRRFSVLGVDTVIGARIWDLCSRFRIRLGPLTLPRYRSFLPGAPEYCKLQDLVSSYCGVEYEWDLVLVLAGTSVPRGWLGNPGFLLGWSAWLGVRFEESDAHDLELPMAPLLDRSAGS